MGISWPNIGRNFKSPLRVAAQVLWRSRENKASRCRELKKQLDEAKETIANREAKIAQQAEEFRRWQAEWRRVDEQRRREASRSCVLPEDPPLPKHKFGCRLIRLAVNLTRLIGLRPAERVLKVVWEWLGVEQELPDWTTIRTWLLRGRGDSAGAGRTRRRLGMDGRSFQSDRAGKGVGGAGRAGLAIAAAGKNIAARGHAAPDRAARRRLETRGHGGGILPIGGALWASAGGALRRRGGVARGGESPAKQAQRYDRDSRLQA